MGTIYLITQSVEEMKGKMYVVTKQFKEIYNTT